MPEGRPDRPCREQQRAEGRVPGHLPCLRRAVDLIDAAMMPIAVLNTPIGSCHPRCQAHAQVEQKVQPSSLCERPMNMKMEEIVRLADSGEYDECREPKVAFHKTVPKRTEQDGRRSQSSQDISPIGGMSNQHRNRPRIPRLPYWFNPGW